jgi:hypothetical protein
LRGQNGLKPDASDLPERFAEFRAEQIATLERFEPESPLAAGPEVSPALTLSSKTIRQSRTTTIHWSPPKETCPVGQGVLAVRRSGWRGHN